METPVLLAAREDCLLLSSDEATVAYIGPERLTQERELVFYVVYGPKATGGSVVIETAHKVAYQGQWAPLARVPFVSAYRVHYQGFKGPFLAMRIRVDDPVVGDTVAVYGVGN